MEKTAEMTFAEALSSVDTKTEKLASAFKDVPIEELEEILKKEASPKTKKSTMVKMSAAEQFELADQWGRDLALEFFKTAGQPGIKDALKSVGSAVMGKLSPGVQEKVKATGAHLAKHRGKYVGAPAYLYGVHRGRKVGGEYYDEATDSYKPKLPIEDQYLPRGKEKKSLALPPGVSSLLGKAMPTVTKGLQGAGKAMAGSSMLGRAGAGAALGAVGGAAQKPGYDPATGRMTSRLGGALRGAGMGAAAGAAAPALVRGAQGAMSKMAPALGK